jgi:hypothetical protein
VLKEPSVLPYCQKNPLQWCHWPRREYGIDDLLTTPSSQTKAADSDMHTNALSHNDINCLRYTLSRNPNLIKNASTRSPEIPSLRTLLRNAKTGPHLSQHSIRQCHRQTSRDDLQAKLKTTHTTHPPPHTWGWAQIPLTPPKPDNTTTALLTHTDA